MLYYYNLQVTAVSIMASAQVKALVGESSMISILHSKNKVVAPIMIKFVGQWVAKRRKIHYTTVINFPSWERKPVKQCE